MPDQIFSFQRSEAERSRLYKSSIQSLKNESSVSRATKVRPLIMSRPSVLSIHRFISTIRQRTCANIGSFALMVYAIVTFLASRLPFARLDEDDKHRFSSAPASRRTR